MNSVPAIDPDVLQTMIDLRREMHANPEIGFDLPQTAERVLRHIRPLPRMTVRTGVARHGIVATLNAGKPGRCVALRADMDCLPLTEDTGVPYASKKPGLMHACGHDGNTSCLVGAAILLSRMADRLPGTVKFIFQPAEEAGGGGRLMCEEGALDNPAADAAFALHGWPSLEIGQIGVRGGPVLAATNPLQITIRGAGAHGAHPDLGVDPIVVASHVIVALQSISSRFTSPTDPVIVTIAKIQAGTTDNIIPETAVMRGTIRSLTPDVRRRTCDRVRQIAEGTAQAFGARAEVQIEDGYPPLINDARAASLIDRAGVAVVGDACVVRTEPPSMGGEDFAYYAERVPAAFFRLGVRPRGSVEAPGLHNPRFNFNDDALPIGAAMFRQIAMDFLTRGWE